MVDESFAYSLPQTRAAAQSDRRPISAGAVIGHIKGRTSGSGDALPFIPRLFAWFPILRTLPALLMV